MNFHTALSIKEEKDKTGANTKFKKWKAERNLSFKVT
jgi:hypothetical protein